MNEYRVKGRKNQEGEEIQCRPQVSHPSGMGKDRQWSRDSGKVSDTPSHPLSLEETVGFRGKGVVKGDKGEEGHFGQEIARGKLEVKGGFSLTKPGIDLFKKRDELGLSGHFIGQRITRIQKKGVIEAVREFVGQQIPISRVLKDLGIPRGSYYRWLEGCSVVEGLGSREGGGIALMPEEVRAIIEAKKKEPWLSHRQISGLLRQEGIWVSESSCYRVLNGQGWVEGRELRERPWDKPRYEPYKPNQIWGSDWTGLRIDEHRYYLLTLIDYFSRYIVAWSIVKTVTQHEVTALAALAVLDQKLDEVPPKQRPLLRLDRGSPNTATVTKEVIQELGLLLSLSRGDRPTDNGRQERFYRTIKQEEIYSIPTYPSVEEARANIGDYITYYNQRRPNQALWNLTPAEVHRVGNKTKLWDYIKEMKQKVLHKRKAYWDQINLSQIREQSRE